MKNRNLKIHLLKRSNLEQAGSLPRGSSAPSSDDVHSVQAGDGSVHGSGFRHGWGGRAAQGNGTEAPHLICGLVGRLGHVQPYRTGARPPAATCHEDLQEKFDLI